MTIRRRDLIAGGSTVFLSAAGATEPSTAAPRPGQLRQIDVRRDFGAAGDGTTDDWLAIENAGLYLERLGGGRMYFPSGRYRLSGTGRNITVRSNIEYFGDGHSSVILGTNAAFISPQGAAFGRSAYGSYAYLPIRDIKAGDRFLEFANPSDVAKFKPGDIVIARSTDAIVTPGDVLPYYVEMNRVVGVAGNRLELEDAIDDGWSGLIAANVTHHVAQGYSIHDLRIECDAGYPFFIQGSYKSVIRNCWTRGFALACFNAFTRSMAHDINATVMWSESGASASLFEIETGSVRANFHDIDVYLSGNVPESARYPLFYCQEFSRRTLLRDIRVAAAGTELGLVFQIMSGGHQIENIDVTARTIDKVLDYFSYDPAAYQLNRLGLTLANVRVETLGATNAFNHGFVLHNDFAGGEVRNVTVRDCTLIGSPGEGDHHLIWFYKGIQNGILFDGVRGRGSVAMNTSARTPNQTGRPSAGDLAFPLKNVMLRNCEFTRITSDEMQRQARYVSCERLMD